MISLTCTHCKSVLTMDDAFAGGACRCQHCGTIQTVPTKLKGNTKVAAPAKGKTLYRNKARDGAAGTGLDDLADAILSSGLSSGDLRRPGAKRRARFMLVFIGTSCLILILASAVIYLAMRGNPSKADHAPSASESPAVSARSSASTGSEAATPVAAKTPNFCGIPLDGQTIIYVLDRGDSTRDLFGDLKQACYSSIDSLGPQKKFQVIFWNNGSDDAFPSGAPTFATKDNLEAARKTLDDIAAHGKTDITPAFTKAIAAKPSTIVIATAKAWDLDDNFVTSIQTTRGASKAKIHTVALSDPGSSTALKRIAGNNAGEFKVVSETELKEFGR
jgi:hypothetical protein